MLFNLSEPEFVWNELYIVNLNKPKEMIIELRKKDTEIIPLKINNQIIELVSMYKYLGVTIDEKIHWSDHETTLHLQQTNTSFC